MKQISAWKTTDGKVFELEDEAKVRQHELDMTSGLESFLSKFYFQAMSLSDLAHDLYQFRGELRKVLKNDPK
jgi:hypothetical protein